MAITTAAEYKAFLSYSGTDRDTWITAMIPVVQEIIEKFCGRPSGGFDSGTYTQDYDGRGGPRLFVTCWPITSITSVSMRGPDGTLTALQTSDYWISADGKSIERAGADMARGLTNPNIMSDDYAMPLTSWAPQFREGKKNYRVVYVGGYATIPYSLKLCAWRMLDVLWATKGQSEGIESESDGHYSAKYGSNRDDSDLTNSLSTISEWAGYIS